MITRQNFSIAEDGLVTMPGFLKGIKIKAKHGHVRQIRVRTDKSSIRIMLMYEQETGISRISGNVMGIDLGVDNLATASLSSGGAPVVINGRPLKSINRYYNKRKAHIQEVAKKATDWISQTGLSDLQRSGIIRSETICIKQVAGLSRSPKEEM